MRKLVIWGKGEVNVWGDSMSKYKIKNNIESKKENVLSFLFLSFPVSCLQILRIWLQPLVNLPILRRYKKNLPTQPSGLLFSSEISLYFSDAVAGTHLKASTMLLSLCPWHYNNSSKKCLTIPPPPVICLGVLFTQSTKIVKLSYTTTFSLEEKHYSTRLLEKLFLTDASEGKCK